MSIKFQRLEIFSSDIRLQESKSTRHPPSHPPESASCVSPQSGARLQRPLLLPSPGLCIVTRQPAPDNVQDPVMYQSGFQESKDLNSRSYYRRIIYFILFLWICDVLAIKIIYKWMSLLYVVIFSDSPFLTLNDFS